MKSSSKQTNDANTWEDLKQKGNELYSKADYESANDLYTQAIDLLENPNNNYSSDVNDLDDTLETDVKVNLAKLYSNRAVGLYQLSQAADCKARKKDYLEEALRNGKKAVKMDTNFDKGHFRCALCLCALERYEEAVGYAQSILDLYSSNGRDFEKDKHLVKLLEDCRYFSLPPDKSPHWDKVKYKNNCKVVSQRDKKSHFTTLEPGMLAFEKELTIVMKPGRYKLPYSIVIQENQNVQIIGDVRRPKDVITIECSGSAFDLSICHLFHVKGGNLSLVNVNLRQLSDHPELHAVYVESGGEVALDNCRCTSSCSGCIAANGGSQLKMNSCTVERACGGVICVGGSYATIENSTFTNCAKIGVETRDRGFAAIMDTKISGCGSQAITAHAGATGFSAERCTLTNNSKTFHGQEACVSCAAGISMVTDCTFTDNKGGGVMVQEGGFCTLKNTTVTGGRYGLGASSCGEAKMVDCTISGVTYGVAVIFNQKGKITLENNTINAGEIEVMLSPDDEEPEIIGHKHKVVTHVPPSMGDLKMALLMEKMSKLGDHFGNSFPWMDPKDFDPCDERVCSPCGLSQRVLATRFMMCSVCKVTWYCSKECQQKDWKLHKQVCQKIQSILQHRD